MAAGMAPATVIEASLKAYSQPWQNSVQSLIGDLDSQPEPQEAGFGQPPTILQLKKPK